MSFLFLIAHSISNVYQFVSQNKTQQVISATLRLDVMSSVDAVGDAGCQHVPRVPTGASSAQPPRLRERHHLLVHCRLQATPAATAGRAVAHGGSDGPQHGRRRRRGTGTESVATPLPDAQLKDVGEYDAVSNVSHPTGAGRGVCSRLLIHLLFSLKVECNLQYLSSMELK